MAQEFQMCSIIISLWCLSAS